MIQAGAIGNVREVHAWSNRNPDISQRGVPRPAETPPVPDTLDWDLWVGPAPMRPYHPSYLPFSLARLVGLRHRGPRRHRLPRALHHLQDPQARPSGERRGLLHELAASQGDQRGDRSPGFHHPLSLRGDATTTAR